MWVTDIEPRAPTADVADVIRRQVNVYGYQLENIAERAGVSMDTVRRVMRLRWPTISLDLADRLLVGAGGHISEVELICPEE